MTTPHGNKRKRGGGESGVSRPSPALRSGAALPQDVSSEMEHYDEGALSQLIAHNNGNHEHHQNGGESNATDTAAAALNHYQMGAATTAYETPSTGGDDSSLSLNVNPGASFSDAFLKAGPGPVDDMPGGLRGAGKPPVGSEEWHKIRRDNHKEVERRRREAINEGINELAKIVPNCEKNKGSILQRAVQYIGQLKENEAQNIEKWTLEKLLLDQAITELSATAERMKNDSKAAWRELEVYKRVCEEHGIVSQELKDLGNEAKEIEN